MLEETGYWTRVRRWIADVDLEHDWQVDKVRFYVMEFVEVKTPKRTEEGESSSNGLLDEEWPPENRQHIWLTLDKAKEKVNAKLTETKQLLDRADTVRSKLA